MIKIIRLYSIFGIFILASCSSNKMIDGVDWDSLDNAPIYVRAYSSSVELPRPPKPPQISPPSPAHAPNFTPMNQPNFIPPPPPFNFVIDFGD